LRTDIQRLHKNQSNQAPQPVAPSEPVAAAQPQPVQAPKPVKKPKSPQPEQDEWGLYDPAQCGFDALYAKIEENAQETQAESEGETPDEADDLSQLFLDNGDNGNANSTESDWVDVSLADFEPAQYQVVAEQEFLPSKTSGLAPLAMWAHANTSAVVGDTAKPNNDLVGLMAQLQLPANVAAVSYPKGCRIHRVRVKPLPQKASSKKSKSKSDEPVLILSRKRLQELREEASEE
jgi:hypothetical protein